MIYTLTYTSANGRVDFSLKSGIVIERIEALDSMDVQFKTAANTNRLGDTVESQRAQGKAMRVIGSILGSAADARIRLLHVIAPLQEAVLEFNGTHRMKVFPKSTPKIERYASNPAFSFVLYAPTPFWQFASWRSKMLLGLTRKFLFPFTMPKDVPFRFSEYSKTAYVNAYNEGEVAVTWRATFYATNEVHNPFVQNFATGEKMQLWHTMPAGSGVVIDCTGDEISVVIHNADGSEENGFMLLDIDSEAFDLLPGDNLIRCGCDEEGTALRAQLQWQPAVSGV